MTRPIAVSSAETAARFHAAKSSGDNDRSRYRPVYASDRITLARNKRRVLLDLAPQTVEVLLRACRRDIAAARDQGIDVDLGMIAIERMLVAALEKAR